MILTDNNQTVDYGDADYSTDDSLYSRMVKFGILVGLEIPTTVCTLAIFYYFIQLRALRNKIHNHV